MEPNIIIRAKQQDVGIVESVLPRAIEKYKQLSNLEVSVFVDKEVFLPQDTTGGVEVHSQTGRIKVSPSFKKIFD